VSRKSVLVLLSGGMDSVTALYDASSRHNVMMAVSFDYGSKHNRREIPFAAHHAEHLSVPHVKIDLRFMADHFRSDLLMNGGEIPKGHYEEESMKATVVPFRNGVMLSIAAGLAESKRAGAIVVAAHAGDHAIYPDCRAGFMAAMADAIALGTYRQVEILRPFISMTKAEIAKRGHELGVDYSKTWSCYVGGEVHCGECGTCHERREAFDLSGLPDPTRYLKTPPLPPRPVATI
jgi:7-cyano-7-deazaguanine synthase